jgi:LPXTG-motif cell wall-anchored protein
MNHIRHLIILGLLIFGFTNAASVAAHADYESSVPNAGETVATAPSQVKIVFTEELKAEGNSISVKDATGKSADNGDTTLDRSDANRKTLLVSLKAGLANGTYTVNWENASTDGHSEKGSFTFVIGSPSTAAPTTLPSTGSEPSLPVAAIIAVVVLLASAWIVRGRAKQ